MRRFLRLAVLFRRYRPAFPAVVPDPLVVAAWSQLVEQATRLDSAYPTPQGIDTLESAR